MTEPLIAEFHDDRLERANSCYASHPMKLVQIQSFLCDHVAETVSELLEEKAVYGPVYGLHNVPGHFADKDQWMRAKESDRFFHYEALDGFSDSGMSKDGLTFLKLRKYLSSKEYCDFARQVCKEEIAGVSTPWVHRLRQEHFLRAHNDQSGARKIAYILYLGRGWKPEFGGHLTILGQGDTQLQIPPVFNSLVLFDITCQKEHQIEPLTQACGDWSRATMSGWFLSEAKS